MDSADRPPKRWALLISVAVCAVGFFGSGACTGGGDTVCDVEGQSDPLRRGEEVTVTVETLDYEFEDLDVNGKWHGSGDLPAWAEPNSQYVGRARVVSPGRIEVEFEDGTVEFGVYGCM